MKRNWVSLRSTAFIEHFVVVVVVVVIVVVVVA
jgi:hypothetical protein